MKIEEYYLIEELISDMEKAGAIQEEPGKWVCRNSLNEIHRDDGPAILTISGNSIGKRYFKRNRHLYFTFTLISSVPLRG